MSTTLAAGYGVPGSPVLVSPGERLCHGGSASEVRVRERGGVVGKDWSSARSSMRVNRDGVVGRGTSTPAVLLKGL
jgi:hypothetical protein